jgi:hypothetical protein
LHSVDVNLRPFQLEYLELQSPFDANSNLLDSWLEDLSPYEISAEKNLTWERYEFSKMTHEFY